jgi:hypothetical protein
MIKLKQLIRTTINEAFFIGENNIDEVKIVPSSTAPIYKQHVNKFKEKFGTSPYKLNLKIGKYNLSGNEYGKKLSWEEGKNFLSPRTRRNAEEISDYFEQDPKYVYIGIVDDKDYSPEQEKQWTERGLDLGFPRLSYYIVWETGDNNYPIAIARKETTSTMAGQTYLVSPIIKKQLSKFATAEFPFNSLFPPIEDNQQVNEAFSIDKDDIDEYDVENEQDIKEFVQFMREYQQELNEADCDCLLEAKYQGRTVPLGKPMRGDSKKFKVYVKNPKTGKVIKVNFGAKGMNIKKNNPVRRKAFRARHNCANPGPRTKARYWSCRKW